MSAGKRVVQLASRLATPLGDAMRLSGGVLRPQTGDLYDRQFRGDAENIARREPSAKAS